MKNNDSENNLLTLLETAAGAIFLVSILLILFTTLLPFNFVFPDNLSLDFIIDRFTKHSSWTDLFANLLLFVPFGFSLAALIDGKKLNRSESMVIVFLCSLILSSSVEFSQVFLPSRAPTSVDLFSNSISGFLGSLSFYAIRDQLEEIPITFLGSLYRFFRPLLSLPSLTLLLIGYVILVSGLLWNLQTATQLNNWDNSFPLIIGDELTGDRSWEGQITQLCISNQAISKDQVSQLLSEENSCNAIADSLIADYDFSELKNNYSDQTGNLPNLEWIETPSTEINEQGIFLKKNHALKTTEPVKPLTEKIRQTSEFTLSTQITTSNLTQNDRARILTISKDAVHRNFMIAQSGSELRVRLRNPITGENGSKPEIEIFDVFLKPKTHHIIISYTGSEFNLYLDSIDNFYTIKFTPEAALFWSIFSSILGEKMPLNPQNNQLYLFLYHGLIFIPLGLILTLISTIYRGNFWFYILLILGGVVLPAFLIEGVLASSINGVWNWENVALNLAIVLVTWVGLRSSFGFRFQSH
ncbi:VanZ family protein [Lyngbya aestuarii]|uniref:VanZ family protein n=1 Tax=Lyngbya aestuarii TaxID=118322 RepID=UPI00068ED231|nr:VanZ family protein [Lyngbya aestuarii]